MAHRIAIGYFRGESAVRILDCPRMMTGILSAYAPAYAESLKYSPRSRLALVKTQEASRPLPTKP